MTRADLVKRLRTENALAGHYGPPAIQVEAADRIEALEKSIREWSTAGNSTEAAVAAINLRRALEAK